MAMLCSLCSAACLARCRPLGQDPSSELSYKQMAAESVQAAGDAVQRYQRTKQAASTDTDRIRSGALREHTRLLKATEGLLDGSRKARREFCSELAGVHVAIVLPLGGLCIWLVRRCCHPALVTVM
jgi:hypothetical protein